MHVIHKQRCGKFVVELRLTFSTLRNDLFEVVNNIYEFENNSFGATVFLNINKITRYQIFSYSFIFFN